MKPELKLFKSMKVAREALGQDVPLQQLMLLSLVGLEPGISMTELAENLGMTQASVSRNLAALGQIHRLGRPGLKLVVTREDPMERRRKTVELTPKGQRFMSAIYKLMEAK